MEKQELYAQLDRLGFHTQEALNRFMGNEMPVSLLCAASCRKTNLASIRQELEAEDEETFYIGVHNLKGLAGNLSMVHIQECAQAILVEFRTSKFKNKKKLSSLIQEAETESEAIVKTIEQY